MLFNSQNVQFPPGAAEVHPREKYLNSTLTVNVQNVSRFRTFSATGSDTLQPITLRYFRYSINLNSFQKFLFVIFVRKFLV